MRRVFVDIETTGLDSSRHEIIEIAMITEWDDSIDIWTAKIKPQRLAEADPYALEVNGYNDEDWADAISIKEAVFQINARLQGKCLFVGYNPSFDLGFIRKAMKDHGYDRSRVYLIDVMTLVQEHLEPAGLKRLSLDSVRDFLEMEKKGSHTALKDAEDTRQLYHRLSRAGWLSRLYWRLMHLFRILKG